MWIALIIILRCNLIFKNYSAKHLLFVNTEEIMTNIVLRNGGKERNNLQQVLKHILAIIRLRFGKEYSKKRKVYKQGHLCMERLSVAEKWWVAHCG